jgi:hypothetical protein
LKKAIFKATGKDISGLNVNDLCAADITEDLLYQLFNEDVFNDRILPMEGAVDVLRDYYKVCGRLVFITYRKSDVYDHTLFWLKRLIGVDSVELFSAARRTRTKSEIATEHGVTSFIDDTLSACQEFIDDGKEAYLYYGKWQKEKHNIPTVFNWEEIGKILKSA